MKAISGMAGTKLLNLIVSLVVIIGCILTVNQPLSTFLRKAQETALYSSIRNLEENAVYILKETDGIIGVFKEGESVPLETYKINVKYFSETDRKLLAEGIRFESLTELKKAIEDFCG